MRIGRLLNSYRRVGRTNEIGLRTLAGELGISAATLQRIEAGKECSGGVLARVFLWMLKEEAEREETDEDGEGQTTGRLADIFASAGLQEAGEEPEHEPFFLDDEASHESLPSSGVHADPMAFLRSRGIVPLSGGTGEDC